MTLRRRFLRIVLAAVAVATLPAAQFDFPKEEKERQLPNEQSRKEALLKDEYQKALKEAGQLSDLADELKAELEKGDPHILSASSIKKTQQIEKLAKRIRSRLNRY